MWRNAALTPKVLGLDMRAYAGFALWLAHMSWTTLWISLFLFVFFAVLGLMKLPLPKLIGKAQTLMVGKICYARPWKYHRFYVGSGRLRDLS